MSVAKQATRRRSLSVLDAVEIARPCPADWDAMHPVPGEDRQRVRHCDTCNLNVYHLSAMPRAEAEAFVQSREGRTCVRLYRRGDGTVLTQDCTYFRRVIRATAGGARRVGWLATCGLAAAIGAAAWAGAPIAGEASVAGGGPGPLERGLDHLARVRPLDRLICWLRPPPPNLPPMGRMVAGAMRTPGRLMGDMPEPQPSVPIPPPLPPEKLLQMPQDERVPL